MYMMCVRVCVCVCVCVYVYVGIPTIVSYETGAAVATAATPAT